MNRSSSRKVATFRWTKAQSNLGWKIDLSVGFVCDFEKSFSAPGSTKLQPKSSKVLEMSFVLLCSRTPTRLIRAVCWTQALSKAARGDGVMVLADGGGSGGGSATAGKPLKNETVTITPDEWQSIQSLALRAYVEFPARNPGGTVASLYSSKSVWKACSEAKDSCQRLSTPLLVPFALVLSSFSFFSPMHVAQRQAHRWMSEPPSGKGLSRPTRIGMRRQTKHRKTPSRPREAPLIRSSSCRDCVLCCVTPVPGVPLSLLLKPSLRRGEGSGSLGSRCCTRTSTSTLWRLGRAVATLSL